MALAAVLSAMRELILSSPELPAEQAPRESYIKKTFPALSPQEAEDLAKINPAKFKIYTNSIFSAERDLIQRNFAMTVEYIKKYWPKYSDKPFSLLTLAKELHKKKPWKSQSSVDLGRNFIDFLNEEFKVIIADCPHLLELAEIELLLRIVRRSPDDQIMPQHSLGPEKLSAMTVEDILNLPYLIPTNVKFKEFYFDLISARAGFISEKLVPEEVSKKHTFASLSRNRDALQRWTDYPESLYDLFSSQSRQQKYFIADAAEAYLSDSDQSKSEEELFKSFINCFLSAVDAGAIVIINN